VVAFAQAGFAFGVRGWTGPLVVLAILALTIVRARVGRRVLPFVVATAPLVASILLVNTFLYPGATDPIVRAGPLAPTWTGLTEAVQATLRVVAFALSVAVLALTTETDDLLADLERRGLGRRGVFVIGAAVRMVPRVAERAREITEAQRARGLDTEGRAWNRARGIVPLVGPVISSSLAEVEERTLALEARAFSAPGRRTPLHALPDSSSQRAIRWAVATGTVTAVALTLTGLVHLP
jgi:energy-coupling factor transport system permease protein